VSRSRTPRDRKLRTARGARQRAAIALTFIGAVILSACGSGLDTATNQIYQAGAGVDHRGQVWVLNTLLVADSDSATLSASVINKGPEDQELTGISVTDRDGKELEVSTAGLPQDLGVEQLQHLGMQDTPIALVDAELTPGYPVKVTLSFSDSADVTLDTPVEERTEMYQDIVQSVPEKQSDNAGNKDNAQAGDDEQGAGNEQGAGDEPQGEAENDNQ